MYECTKQWVKIRCSHIRVNISRIRNEKHEVAYVCM